MKTLLLSAALCFAAGAHAQSDDVVTQPRADRISAAAPVAKKSPMNSASMRTPDGYARIVYSQPMLRGRDMLGDQVPYGKIWRLGANEATEIFTTADVTVAGEPLPAGAYSVFAIPSAEEWTLVFSKQLGEWGAYNYDDAQDALRVSVPVTTAEESFEAFTTFFEDGNLVMAWGPNRVTAPLAFAK